MDLSQEQWTRVKALLDSAIGLPRADRAAFLTDALADDRALLEYSLELLSQYDQATQVFADSRADEAATASEPQTHFAPGTLVAHFRIVRRIGEGGMGIVYLANDERLHRQVALKFVVPRLRTVLKDARAQLLAESRSNAALDHPQIVTLLDVVEWNGDVVLVMQYVEGEPLSDLIAREPLPLAFAIRTVMQIADATAHAHGRGIVHCDLKPANIHLLQTGGIKILDFGLARAATLAQTAPNELRDFGTPAYLAPERFMGSAPTSSSDVFALGVTFYEALTGVSPFQDADTLERLTQDPIPPSAHMPAIPQVIDEIVMRCLSRVPRERLQAHELSRALSNALAQLETVQAQRDVPERRRRQDADRGAQNSSAQRNTGVTRSWGRRSAFGATIMAVLLIVTGGFVWPIITRPDGPQRPSVRIAVLPFENAAGLPEWEADAASNDMLNALALLPGTSVTPWSSVAAYAPQPRSAGEIATFLTVDWVMTGRVRTDAPNLAVAIALFDKTGRQVWTREFRTSASTLMTLPSEVLRVLPNELGLSSTRAAEVRHTPLPAARAAWAQARYLMRATGTADFNRARGLLEEAIRIDPEYAQAYVTLARYLMQLENSGGISRDDAGRRASVALERAAQLDNASPELYLALGLLRFEFDWDWDRAGQAFRLAIQLNQSDPETRVEYASYLAARGDLPEAIQQVRSAQDIDPGSPHRGDVAFMLYFARRYAEAIALYEERIENEPDESLRRYSLARAYSAAGRYDDAVAQLRMVQELVGGEGRVLGFDAELARVYAPHRAPEARAIATSLEGRLSDSQPNLFAQVAFIYAALGERDRAFEYLQHAGRLRAKSLIWAKVDPRLDPLRNDRRYLPFVQGLGLPQ